MATIASKLKTNNSALNTLFTEMLAEKIIPDLRLYGNELENGICHGNVQTKSSKLIKIESNSTNISQNTSKFLPLSYLNDQRYKQSILHLSKSIEDIINYNVIGGKCLRAKLLLTSFEEISLKCKSKPESIKQNENTTPVLACAWAIEFIQAAFLVADDIMDKSEIRRGKVCWYKKVGLEAINDSFILETLAYKLIHIYTKTHINYNNILKVFMEVTELTKYGQALDMNTESETDFTKVYTFERYYTVITFKTCFYTVYLPIICSILLTNNEKTMSEASVQKLTEICLEIGKLFQVQDDYLDCYGDYTITGKIGTDIQDKKCSWLIVNAISLANESQIELLKNHYGKDNKNDINEIVKIFDDLNLKKIYLDYQNEKCGQLKKEIAELENFVPKDTLVSFLDLLMYRNK